MLLRQGPFFVTTRIALQGHILFFQIKGGQLNGTNVLLQTMRWNNRMVRCPRGWARVMSYDWWYLTQATPVAEEALPITSNRRPYAGDQRDCCGRPSPTIYFLFFMVVCSLLPIQYQLCLETFQLLLYGCPHKTMTVGGETDRIASPPPHHMRRANREAFL